MIENYGILSLLPTALVLVIAIVTKKAIAPLVVGVVVSFLMLDGIWFASGFVNAAYATFQGDTLGMIVLITILFGILVQLLDKSQAAQAFSAAVNKHVTSAKSSLFASWAMGILLFIDDFLNAIVVGTTMRRTTDRYGVPREMLAYVVDVTAAPMAVLLPFSAWAIFFMSMFGELGLTAQTGLSEFDMYWHVVPFIFYSIIAILIVPLVIVGIIPPLGQMRDACEKASLKPIDRTAAVPEIGGAKPRHFIIPVLVLVIITFATEGDVVQGAIIATIVAAGLFLHRGFLTKRQLVDSVHEGIVSMLPVIGIVFFALVLVEGNARMGTTEFVVETMAPIMSPELLPCVTFLIVSILAFGTGSFFGTAAVVMPIIVPLALGSGCDIFLVLGATISGAVFGSNCCFFGDATVLTASSCQITPIRHALAQLPYGLIAWALAMSLYVLFGFVL